jgi:two-component system, cell cycle sensor histidine kinase and response regulator CckA
MASKKPSNSKESSEMESSLRLSDARLAGILASAMDAIITVDENQCVVLFNEAAQKMFRCSSAEAMGEPLDRFIPVRLREAHRAHVEEFGKTKISQRTMGKLRTLAGLRSTGEEFPIEASISQVNVDGHKLYTVIIRDVSEKKGLEAQFLRSQRMESIGTLAGGIAHDLNNVLSPILTAVELLQMRFTDETSQRLLDILHTNAIRGSEMVKQVLSFARGVEGTYLPLKPAILIEEIVRILRETLPKNIRISVRDSGTHWSVMGDATHLHQVLMNLCVNARDAMPHGGELTLECENVEIDGHNPGLEEGLSPGRYVCILVSDSGIGIPVANLSKIFDPFFTTKGQTQGTGLGLSTVAGILRSHRGFVTIESEVNHGSMFKIFLPAVAASTQAAGGPTRPALPSGNSELILVVDDEKAIREIARETLMAFNYEVLTASDGAEALALFAQHLGAIRCVITDMAMPFLDGPATIRALRRLSPDLRIIAMSGMAAQEKMEEAASLGITSFLEKPYTAERLLTAVDRELRK